MRMYRGAVDCPGCGVPASKEARTAKDQVCFDCQQLIRIGKARKEKPDRFVRVRWNDRNTSELFLTIKDVEGQPDQHRHSDSLGYISEQKNDRGNSRIIAKAFQTLLKTIDQGNHGDFVGQLNMQEGHEHFYISAESAMAIHQLYSALVFHVRAHYQNGFNDGRNMIFGLADGSLSMDDLNNQVTRVSQLNKK